MSKYNDIMEKITVTEEMRERVLKNVEKAVKAETGRVISLDKHRPKKRYLPIAAAVAVAVVGIAAGSGILNQSKIDDSPTLAVNPITEYTSAEELSEAVGFDVSDICLEQTGEVSYIAYSGELAEVTYKDGERETVLRKSVYTGADEDISGDYNVYAEEGELELNGTTVTTKGDNGKINLALWTRAGYCYSFYDSDGITAEELETLILR